MTVFFEFALLGLGAGAIYALAAQGIVLIYRGSGVLNFAQGAMALLAAGFYTELTQNHGWSDGAAMAVAVALTALLGFLIEFLIMRRLRHASPLARLVAILGVLGLLQSIAVLRYGQNFAFVNSFIPAAPIHVFNGVIIGEDRFFLLGIAAAVTAVLWAVYRFTTFGRWTTAVAENRRSASCGGVSPNFVASANWAIGGALAGVAGVLIVPITSLDPSTITLLILPALAAAMVGRFASFPLTLLGGVLVGVGESLLQHYVTATGWAQSLPFLIIIVVVVVQGRALPVRGYMADRLPIVGSSKAHWGAILVAIGIGFVLIFTLSGDAVNAILGTFVAGLVCLSLVVVTGLAGQLSLGQLAFAGLGGFVAARLAEYQGLSFVPALLCAVAIVVPVGVVFGLPALRTRGVNLAIVTLGLGYAIYNIVLLSPNFTGGYKGLVVKQPAIFGWNIGDISHPQRYASVALVLFALCGIGVMNLRRGRAGRRLMATRANERAAASVGISAMGAKLYAFALASGIAAVSGVLSTFQYPNVQFLNYDPITSITFVLLAFLGGIGYVSGSGFAGAIAIGGIITYALSTIINFNSYQGLVSSALLILVVLQSPDGIMHLVITRGVRLLASLRERLGRTRAVVEQTGSAAMVSPQFSAGRCAPKTLEAEGISVRFGGVVALSDVSLRVGPGEVVGLIGPNGAGKTTMIDAITGFNDLATGTIRLDGADLNGVSAYRRTRAGVSRTFQNLELFEDMTVDENLRAACDPGNRLAYLTDLIVPRTMPLPPPALRAIDEFQFGTELSRRPGELSFGRRRLLGLVRALATSPSILLLDEPAAGLDDAETREFGRAVRRLADDWGMGVLLIEHDMALVMSICDRVVVLDFGGKICEGPPEQVQRDERVIAAYLGEDQPEEPVAVGGESPSAAGVG